MAGSEHTTNTNKDENGRELIQWSRKPVVLACLLAFVTFFVFAQALRNDFVNYDDPDYVTSNPHVQAGLTWRTMGWAMTAAYASNWHPLTWISHMLDWQVFGNHAAGHHFTSILLHVANSVLVLLVLRALTAATWRSLFVAALFALHPLHVESVAWISERKDVLSGFFFLLTLWAYAAYAQSREPGWDRRRFYLLALIFHVLGLMSKPMLVTVPFVLLLLDYWPLHRFEWLHFKTKEFVAAVSEKVPFLLLSLASSIVTFVVQKHGGAVSTSIAFGARVANGLVAYVAYLAKLSWPFKLSVLYPHPGTWPAGMVLGAAFVLLLLTVLVIRFAAKRPYLFVGWFLFTGMLVPVIGLVQVGVQSMADRYTYLPLLGCFIIISWGLAEVIGVRAERAPAIPQHALPREAARASRTREGRTQAGGPQVAPLLLSAIGAVMVLCVLRTSSQLGYWRNSETLFRHAVEVTRGNYLAYNNLGFYLSGLGRVEEAMENYRRAVELNPNYEDAQNNLGYALAGQKRFLEAIPHYQAALRVKPEHVEVHNNLGNAYAELGRTQEAIEQYLFVLARDPKHADAHNNLGIALAMQGKTDEAIAHFKAALTAKPDYASAHSNLGNALAAEHRFKEAIQEYTRALELKSDDPQAHNNLANVLSEEGRLDEAIPHYEQALRLNRDNPEAHFNLAMALRRKGQTAEALEHCREALRLKPDYTDARRQIEELSSSNPAR